MSAVRILHVSDLHMREAWSQDQGRVLRAFFRDIEKQQAEKRVNVVVFTGDLAFSANPAEYSLATAMFLNPLERVLEIQRENIVLVPGNHDIDRGRISKIIEAGLESELTGRDAVNATMRDDQELLAATARVNPWRTFRDDFYGSALTTACCGLASVHHYEIDSVKLSVASVCSSWRATGGPDDFDRARLLIGERQLEESLGTMQKDAIRLVAMHHPIEWLTDFDRADTIRELSRNADIVLSGHVHMGDSIHIVSRQGAYIQSAAGSLYAERAYLNSYSILDYSSETDQLSVTFRTYYDDRDDFGLGENLVEGGMKVFDLKHLPPEVLKASQAASLSRTHLRDVVMRSLGTSATNEGARNDLLIQPVFLPLPMEQYVSATNPETGKRIDLPNIIEDLNSGDVIVVAGEESAGLTSALAWLLLAASDRDYSISPALIDFKHLDATKDPLDRATRRWLMDSGFQIHPTKSTEDLPPLAIAVDNFDPRLTDKRGNRVVAHLATAGERARIIGCRPHQVKAVEGLLKTAGLQSRRRYLGRFGRKHIRELSLRLDQNAPDKLAEAAIILFNRERIPRTPFMIIAVLEILSTTNYGFAGGSETDVLNAHADRLLGRADTSEDQRFDFDYRNRQHLLSRLAFEMLKRPAGQIARLDAEEFVLNYLRARDQALPVSDVLNIFIDRKILWEREGILGFRQPAMLHFFAASAAIEDDALRQLLLDDPLSFATAVRHAAMLRRDDGVLLAKMASLLEASIEGLSQDGQYFSPEDPADPRDWFDDEGFAKRVVETAETEKSRSLLAPSVDPDFDQLMDALDQRSELYEGEGLSTQEGAFGLLQTVSFCGSVLRSSELVSDTELRARTLQLVISAYAIAAKEIAEHEFMETAERFVVALVEADHFGDKIDEKFLARLIKLFRRQFPSLVAGMEMSNWLSSPKLAEPIRGCLNDEVFMSKPGNALMAAMLWLESGGDDSVTILGDVLTSHYEVPAVVSSIQFLALGMNQAVNESNPRRRQVEELAVRASTAGIRYDSPRERARHRNAILDRIHQKRLSKAFKNALPAGASSSMAPWDIS